MKVVIVNTLYFPNHIGGAEKSVQLIAEHLVKEGHSVTVFSNGNNNLFYEHNGVEIRQYRTLNIYNFLSKKKHGKLFRALWHFFDMINPFYIWTLYKTFKKERPEVLWSNNLSGFSVSFWFISSFFRIPIVHTVRDYYLLCPSSTMFRYGRSCEKQCLKCKIMSFPKKLISQKVDAIVGISNYILQKHIEYSYFPNARFSRIIYNSVLDEKEGTCRNILYNSSIKNEVRFGFLGSLDQSKGIEFLLSEFKLLLSSYEGLCGIKLIIGGKGESSYEKYLKTNFNSPRIMFLGKVNPDSFFADIDYLVVPSLWDEPFGRVVVEAFQNHKIVLATNRGGLEEFNKIGNVDYFKIEEGMLAELMKKCIVLNPPFNIKKWEEYKVLYNSSIVSQQYIELFKEVSNV